MNNLEEICGILDDEGNEINLADDFLVSSIEEVRKIKCTEKAKSNSRMTPSYIIHAHHNLSREVSLAMDIVTWVN